jgi:hypothetical protein
MIASGMLAQSMRAAVNINVILITVLKKLQLMFMTT